MIQIKKNLNVSEQCFHGLFSFFNEKFYFAIFLIIIKVMHIVELCIYQLHVIYVFEKIGGIYFICLKLCNQMPETGGL